MRLTNEKGDYCVAYDAETGTISCEGLFAFRGSEGYRMIAEVFEKAVEDIPVAVTLDIRHLEYLNCSGIAAIGGLIINTREKGAEKLKVRCSREYPWQKRCFGAISKFMPGMEFTFE